VEFGGSYGNNQVSSQQITIALITTNNLNRFNNCITIALIIIDNCINNNCYNCVTFSLQLHHNCIIIASILTHPIPILLTIPLLTIPTPTIQPGRGGEAGKRVLYSTNNTIYNTNNTYPPHTLTTTNALIGHSPAALPADAGAFLGHLLADEHSLPEPGVIYTIYYLLSIIYYLLSITYTIYYIRIHSIRLPEPSDLPLIINN
jgi:hypothetical protein